MTRRRSPEHHTLWQVAVLTGLTASAVILTGLPLFGATWASDRHVQTTRNQVSVDRAIAGPMPQSVISSALPENAARMRAQVRTISTPLDMNELSPAAFGDWDDRAR